MTARPLGALVHHGLRGSWAWRVVTSITLCGIPVLFGCRSSQQAATDAEGETLEHRWQETEVQDAAIESIVAINHPAAILVVGTRRRWFGDPRRPVIPDAAWPDFVRRAQKPGLLLPMYGPTTRLRVGADRRIEAARTDTALIALSGVGVAPSGALATVFVDYRCGALCGSAAIQSFRREGTKWILVRSVELARY